MKQFLVIGFAWSINYRDLFPLFKNEVYGFGVSHRGMDFVLPDGSLKSVNACWFTNIDLNRNRPPLELTCKYDASAFPKYDNYDVIEVSKTSNIPYDYDGVMGVPISFLDKWCPSQFELICSGTGSSWANYPSILSSLGFNPSIKGTGGLGSPILDGKVMYTRLFIRRRKMFKPPLH